MTTATLSGTNLTGYRLFSVVSGATFELTDENGYFFLKFMDNGRISGVRSNGSGQPPDFVSMKSNGTDIVKHFSLLSGFTYAYGSPNGKHVFIVSTMSTYLLPYPQKIDLVDYTGITKGTLHDYSLGPVLSVPSWSPDSKFICYVGATGVFKLNVATGERKAVVDFSKSQYPQITFYRSNEFSGGYIPSNTSWSMDGRYVAFNADHLGVKTLFSVDMKSGEMSVIAPLRNRGDWVFWGS